MMYDLIIIGGGPAGVSAGVYASRKQLRTALITPDWGGQSIVSPDIQNWIGSPSISGPDLATSLRTHLETYAGAYVDVLTGQTVATITRQADGTFMVTTSADTTHLTRSILIGSGSSRRRLTAPGADIFEHKGVTYCASCDGPLFAGQDVAVIGGGNAGFETAAQLLAYAKSVSLLHRGGQYKADPVTVDKVLSHPAMTGILNAETISVNGEKFVTGLTYRDCVTNAEYILPVTGIFVEIGMIPNTDFAAEVVTRDEYGRITIDPWTQKTSTPGIWAAGDCTNVKYHQNNISAGDGVRALEDIYVTLKTK
jgi:alkyl hydroperoxide reductase subunit F